MASRSPDPPSALLRDEHRRVRRLVFLLLVLPPVYALTPWLFSSLGPGKTGDPGFHPGLAADRLGALVTPCVVDRASWSLAFGGIGATLFVASVFTQPSRARSSPAVLIRSVMVERLIGALLVSAATVCWLIALLPFSDDAGWAGQGVAASVGVTMSAVAALHGPSSDLVRFNLDEVRHRRRRLRRLMRSMEIDGVAGTRRELAQAFPSWAAALTLAVLALPLLVAAAIQTDSHTLVACGILTVPGGYAAAFTWLWLASESVTVTVRGRGSHLAYGAMAWSILGTGGLSTWVAAALATGSSGIATGTAVLATLLPIVVGLRLRGKGTFERLTATVAVRQLAVLDRTVASLKELRRRFGQPAGDWC